MSIPIVYPYQVPSGCVLSLDMQDIGNKLIDHSGQSNHGTNNGSTPIAVPNGWARSFDGADDYIGIPNFMGSATIFTVAHWVNLNADQTSKTIFSNYTTLGTGWVMGISDTTANILKFYLGSATLSSVTALQSGRWSHVAITYNNGSPKIYINGTLDASSSDTITFSGSFYGNDVGRLGSGAQYFNGKIGKVEIFKRALSISEIKKLFYGEAWRYGIS